MMLLLLLKIRTLDTLINFCEVIPVLQTEMGGRLFFPDEQVNALETRPFSYREKGSNLNVHGCASALYSDLRS